MGAPVSHGAPTDLHLHRPLPSDTPTHLRDGSTSGGPRPLARARPLRTAAPVVGRTERRVRVVSSVPTAVSARAVRFPPVAHIQEEEMIWIVGRSTVLTLAVRFGLSSAMFVNTNRLTATRLNIVTL